MSQQINLFNPLFIERKERFTAKTMLMASGLLVVGCAALASYLTYKVNSLTKQAAAADAQLSTSGSQLKLVKLQRAHREKDPLLEVQVQQTEQEIQSLRKVLSVLKEGNIGNTQGYSAYMQAFARQNMDGIWLTGFSVEGAGKQIEITGRATKPDLLPHYINRLKKEPIMQGKNFGTLEMQVPEARPLKVANEGPGKTPAFIEFKLN